MKRSLFQIKKYFLHLLLVSILALISITGTSQADLILYNGKVFTSDKKQLWAEAIAIKDERIIAVGKNNEVLKFKGNGTKMIDLEQHLVIPGFNDAHHHETPSDHSRIFSFKNGPFAPTSWEEARDSISAIVKEVPANILITATINPELLNDRRVRRKALDSIAPDNPVILYAWTGHESILNSAALKLIGYNDETRFIGGLLEQDDEGKLTGLIEEYGEFQIWSRLAQRLTLEQIAADIRSDYNTALSYGITTDQVMTTGLTAQTFQKVFKENDFGCRIRLMAFPFTDEKEFRVHDWDNMFHALNNKNYISGVKMILDATPLDHGACMTKSYSGEPGNYGHLDFSEEQIRSYLQYCLANNQQVIVHAVGDSSVNTLIKAMRSLHPDNFWRPRRVRIEHGEFAVMKPGDLKRLQQLGIMIIQNPTHLSLPSVLNEMQENYAGRRSYLQPMRSLLDNNIPFGIGTDGPVNPFLNIMMATIHPDNPREAITLPEAVIAYTYGSAYAEFKEKEKGTLEKGKLADLAVLSQDIFTVNRNLLPATQSILTMVGGKIFYDKKVLKMK